MHVCVYQLIHCSDLLCVLLSWIYTYICHCSGGNCLGNCELGKPKCQPAAGSLLEGGNFNTKNSQKHGLIAIYLVDAPKQNNSFWQLIPVPSCTKKSPGHDQSGAISKATEFYWVSQAKAAALAISLSSCSGNLKSSGRLGQMSGMVGWSGTMLEYHAVGSWACAVKNFKCFSPFLWSSHVCFTYTVFERILCWKKQQQWTNMNK